MDWLDSIINAVSGMKMDSMIGAGSAVIALLSALFSWSAMRRQDKRAAVSLKMAHDNDIIRWSDEAILVLADAHEMLCEKGVAYSDNEFRQKRSGCRARLSAIVDRGRLFFPNVDLGDGHGDENEHGFRGHRQLALESLVAAYDLLGRAGDQPGPDQANASELRAIRRGFVGEIFKTVDPQRRGATLKELAK